MALSTPTSLGTFATDNTGETPHGTGPFDNSITTVNNSLLVVNLQVGGPGVSSDGNSATVSGGGLTFTRRTIQNGQDGDGNFFSVQQWTAPVTTGATFDLSVHCGSINVYAYKVNPVYYTGHDTTTPTGATASGTESPASGALTITLSGAPASTSSVIAAVMVVSETTNIAPGSGWTEIADFYGTESFSQLETQHRTGSTSTSVAWTTVTSTFGGDSFAVALEIIEGAASDTTPDAFTFTDQTGVEPGATVTSAAITVAGINAAAAISITGGTYDINSSGSFTSSSGTVNNGDTVRVRVTAASTYITAVNAALTIGGVSDTFTATTRRPVLSDWETVRAAVAAGSRHARVLCIGDSITAGAEATGNEMGSNAISAAWPTVAAANFNAAPALASAWVGSRNVDGAAATLAQYDSRITLGTGWGVSSGLPTLGADFITRTGGGTSSLGFAPGHSFDRMTVWYRQVSGSPEYTVNINGGSSLGTLNMNETTTAIGAETFSFSAGSHTFNVVAAADNGNILGMLAYTNADEAAHFINAGWYGGLTTEASTSTNGSHPIGAIQVIAPDLAIIMLGANDRAWGATSETNYKNALRAIIDAAHITGPAVLVVPPYSDPDDAEVPTEATQDTFNGWIADIATERSCTLLDLTERTNWTSYAASVTAGYMADTYHPTGTGYADIAAAILEVIDVSVITLVVADCTHGHSVDSPALTQANTLSVADALHAQAVDNVALTQAHSLTVADAVHANAVDNVALTQANTLAIADALHTQTVDSPDLVQANVLVVADAAHVQTVDSVELNQSVSLAVQDALHAHLVDNVALTQAHVLVVADAVHANSADNVALLSGLSLIVADALHSNAVDNVSLTQANMLSVADAIHSQSVDNVVLVQAHVLTVDDATHSQTVEQITLSQAILLQVADALHSQSVDGVTLTQGHVLAVASAIHLHAADSIDLTQASTLIVDDALHAHLADALSLRMPADDLGRQVFVIRRENRVFVVAREPRLFRIH